MMALLGQFAHGQHEICFLGLGNPDYADDGFGIRLAEELSKVGVPNVLIAGTEPERYLGQIVDRQFGDLVFLDAVDFGGKPGSLVVLGAEEMRARFPQISTHKISLGTLATIVQANGKTRVWLVGVQPESLEQGRNLTPAIQKTLELAKDLLEGGGLLEGFKQSSEHPSTEEHAC